MTQPAHDSRWHPCTSMMVNDAIEYSVVVRCGGAIGAWLSDKWPQDSRRAGAREIRQANVRTSPRKLRGPMLSRGERARQRVTGAGCYRKSSLTWSANVPWHRASGCKAHRADPGPTRWSLILQVAVRASVLASDYSYLVTCLRLSKNQFQRSWLLSLHCPLAVCCSIDRL